jgi:hypothetical protein
VTIDSPARGGATNTSTSPASRFSPTDGSTIRTVWAATALPWS